jgi:hypothetical protein
MLAQQLKSAGLVDFACYNNSILRAVASGPLFF